MSQTSKLVLHYPLNWPLGWPRIDARTARTSDFSQKRTFAVARDFLAGQLRLLDSRTLSSARLSTDCQLNVHGSLKLGQAQPTDRGVALYFKLQERDMVLACDRWNRVECNIYAIGRHIECLRALKRYGVGTDHQAFAGYHRLPGSTDPKWWAGVLQVSSQPSAAEISVAHRGLVLKHHPDQGGTHEDMARLNAARDAALQWLEQQKVAHAS